MLQERIEGKWLAAFRRVLALNGIGKGTQIAILSETQSRPVLVHLCELAAYDLGADFCMIQMPTPPQTAPVPVKSTGTTWAIAGNRAVIEALKLVDVIVDCTVEGHHPRPRMARDRRGGPHAAVGHHQRTPRNSGTHRAEGRTRAQGGTRHPDAARSLGNAGHLGHRHRSDGQPEGRALWRHRRALAPPPARSRIGRAACVWPSPASTRSTGGS